MASGKVTDEEVLNLRRIYEVLMRDAADVYDDLRTGVVAYAHSFCASLPRGGAAVVRMDCIFRFVPPVAVWQWAAHVAMVVLIGVVAYQALSFYRRFSFLTRKYEQLWKIAKETKAKQ